MHAVGGQKEEMMAVIMMNPDVCMYVCMYVCMCVFVCGRGEVCVCMYACMYVRMCAHTCACVHIRRTDSYRRAGRRR
jgi:hypothetical protein